MTDREDLYRLETTRFDLELIRKALDSYAQKATPEEYHEIYILLGGISNALD